MSETTEIVIIPQDETLSIEPKAAIRLEKGSGYQSVLALSQTHPGEHVLGLGALPEAIPLSEPTFAYRAAEGCPTPSILAEAKEFSLMIEDPKFQIVNHVGHDIGAFLVTHFPARRLSEIANVIDYRRRRLRSEMAVAYQAIEDGDFQAQKQQELEVKLKTHQENQTIRAERIIRHQTTDSEDMLELTKRNCAHDEKREQQEIDRLYQGHLDLWSEYFGYASTKNEQLMEGTEPIELNRVPGRLRAQSILELGYAVNVIKRHTNHKIDEVRRSLDGDKYDLDQEVHGSIAKVIEAIPYFQDRSEYQKRLTSAFMDVAKEKKERGDSYYDVICPSTLSEAMTRELIPLEVILAIYDEQTKQFVINPPPQISKDIEEDFITTLTPRCFSDDNTLGNQTKDYLRWHATQKYPKDPERVAAIVEAIKYPIRNPASMYGEEAWIGGKYLEENTSSQTSEKNHNTQVVHPFLPSQEALQEIKERVDQQNPESTCPTGFDHEWGVAAECISKLDIEPKVWMEWAKSLKLLGLSGRSNRWRNSQVGWLVSPVIFQTTTGHFLSDAEYARDTVAKFPDQDEILAKAAEKSRGYHHRNHGLDTLRNLTMAPRMDREHHWGKYSLKPDQWLELYTTAYQEMKSDYRGDGKPESQVCMLRGSLMTVITGNHEQAYYKTRDGALDPGEAGRLDELDLIMFLPALAADNKQDVGVFLTGIKALLQMDPQLRELYAAEIKASFAKVISANPYLTLVTSDPIGSHSLPAPTIDFAVNASGNPKRVDTHRELAIHNAIDTDSEKPEVAEPRVMYFARFVHEPDRRGRDVLTIINRNQLNAALTRFRAKYPDIPSHSTADFIIGTEINQHFDKEADRRGKELQQMLFQECGLDPALYPDVFLETTRSSFDAGVMPQFYNDTITDKKDLTQMMITGHTMIYTDKQWIDTDIGINPKTAELESKNKPPIVFAEMSSAIERIHHSCPDLAKKIEAIAATPETTELKALFTMSHLVEVMTGAQLSPDNLPELLIHLTQIEKLASDLRGASPEEKSQILNRLTQPLEQSSATINDVFNLVWLASGALEREEVANTIIRGTTAAFRISVQRIVEQIKQHQIPNLAAEYETELGLSEADATEAATKSVANSIFQGGDNITKIMADLRPIPSGDPAESSPPDYLKFQVRLTKTIGKLVADISRYTDYHYASTHWLQLVDQVMGQDYLNSEGRVNLYCVQASFMLYELLMDMCSPLSSESWATPPAAFIALEDEDHGVPVMDFFRRLSQEKLHGQDLSDSYTHYFVLFRLPQRTSVDKPYHLLIDQTTNQIRVIPETAIISSDKKALIFDNQKTRNFSVTGEQIPRETGTSRILLAPEALDQSLTMVGSILEGAHELRPYNWNLNSHHPLTHLDKALLRSNPEDERGIALTNLVTDFPFFLGVEGLVSEPQYHYQMTQLMELADGRLPTAGLFISNILMHKFVNGKTHASLNRSDFVFQLASMSEPEYSVEMTQFEHLLTNEDRENIQDERLRLAKMNAEAIEAERKRRQQDLHERYYEDKVRLKIEIDSEEQSGGTKDYQGLGADHLESGSKAKLKQLFAKVETKSAAQAVIFAADTPVNAQIELNVGDPHALSSVALKHRPPLEVAPITAEMAAQLLKHILNPRGEPLNPNQVQALEAIWRAVVHDARRDSGFRVNSHNQLVKSLATASSSSHVLTASDPQGSLIHSGVRPLILEIPIDEILELIQGILPNLRPNPTLLNHPEQAFVTSAENRKILGPAPSKLIGNETQVS